MSNKRYIEVDSTYRNRNEWPLPGEFQMLISQSGRKNRENADDPVSLATPENNLSWLSNNFDAAANSPTLSVTIDAVNAAGIGASGDDKTVIQVSGLAGVLNTLEDYYKGAVVTDGTNSSRIVSYTYNGSDRAQITLSGNVVFTTGSVTISDPSDISDPTNAFMFIPDGRNGNNAYNGCLLYNETTNNSVEITNYDGTTKLATLGDITGLGWSLTAPQHTYSVRKETPQIGTVNNNVANPSNQVFSFPTTFSQEQNVYKNSFIRMTSGAAAGETRRISRYETLTGNALSGTANTVVFPSTASNLNGYYNNMYIQILSGAAAGDVRQISDYTVSGLGTNLVRTATVSTPFSAAISTGDSFTFRSGIVTSPFSGVITNGDSFELLLFSYDNHNPFSYTGSLVSQQEMVCYEIELLNLVLPNDILNSVYGNRIAFYPYVYVELSNVSGAGAGIKNSIYSNNPNSTRMLFRAAIDDVPNPVISSFISIDGNGMVQTIKFKPNDNLRFSVILPNGEIYETREAENLSPMPPNANIQISALFSIKRL